MKKKILLRATSQIVKKSEEAELYCKRHRVLLQNIKAHLPQLQSMLDGMNQPHAYEDHVYRFYHHSFKVQYAIDTAMNVVVLLRKLTPHDGKNVRLNDTFEHIIEEGISSAKLSSKHASEDSDRRILEALFHTKYFLEMAVKYGQELKQAPEVLPYGWAALLHLYNCR